MTKYIIFGAGRTGRKACDFLGYPRVHCFASNSPSEKVNGKEVISFSEMKALTEEQGVIVVIASELYAVELVRQVEEAGIQKWFQFHETDPVDLESFYASYWLYGRNLRIPYHKLLSDYQIRKYKKIAIYGTNFMLPYLISEISIQNECEHIVGVIETWTGRTNQRMGLPACELEDVWDEIDCLIVNVRENEDSIRNLIADAKDVKFDVIDMYDADFTEPAFRYPNLEQFKDKHKGKRGFVIGNGPSLTIEDLETLHEHGEICIAANKVYRAYSKTKWRADYLGITDWLMYQDLANELRDIPGEIFISDFIIHVRALPISRDVFWFHGESDNFDSSNPRFSSDFSKGAFNGWCVTYTFGLQLAAYLGLTEIYLLGIDHNYSEKVTDKGSHFIDNYFSEEEKKRHQEGGARAYLQEMTRAYERAEQYSRAHGFRIYNATRGGKLEVFERVDFDQLFG